MVFSRSKTIHLYVLVFICFSCDPFHVKIDDTKYEITDYTAASIAEVGSIEEVEIMNWNIKFGGGRIDFFWDCYGDRAIMDENEVIDNMNLIIDHINHVKPDILFLQEVDIESKRSAYIDQVQMILDNTELNYGVYAPNWKADYIPSDGMGRMNSGGAILSKWKIQESERIALPLIEEQAATTRHFYLRRNYIKSKINIEGQTIYFLNIHASAYAQDDTKKKQLEIYKEDLDDLNASGAIFIAGGDFNNIPPGSTQLTDFNDALNCDDDFPPDDFTDQIDWMKAYYEDYEAAIPFSDYQADNSKYFSFTADKNGFWNRKLDHIFTNDEFVTGSGMVRQDITTGGFETMPCSDHAAVTVRYKVK